MVVEGESVAMILTVVDHASNHVPPDIDLGIASHWLDQHIAWDIGAAALAEALGYPMQLAQVSRLVVDLNRDPDDPAVVPRVSDGVAIPGNAGDLHARLATYWWPYHGALADRIAVEQPSMLLSLHSFTPQLAGKPQETRPWEIGILYDNDERAARVAIPLLEAAGIVTGDQLPYSGKLLNATMNRHGEANGIAYLGLEVRQDLIGDAAGARRWADRLRPIIDAVAGALP